MADGAPFRVLFVCTGNICRSPMAEHLLRDQLDDRFGPEAGKAFQVSSAGTYGLVDEPMPGPALDLLAARGIPGDGFRARALVPAQIEDADLVLAMALEHRAAAVTLVPRAAARCFTLREFARLAAAAAPAAPAPAPGRLERGSEPGSGPGGDPAALAEAARALVVAAGRMRGLIPAVAPAEDEVADPYRRSVEHYAEAGRLIEEALRVVVDRIGSPAAVQ